LFGAYLGVAVVLSLVVILALGVGLLLAGLRRHFLHRLLPGLLGGRLGDHVFLLFLHLLLHHPVRGLLALGGYGFLLGHLSGFSSFGWTSESSTVWILTDNAWFAGISSCTWKIGMAEKVLANFF